MAAPSRFCIVAGTGPKGGTSGLSASAEKVCTPYCRSYLFHSLGAKQRPKAFLLKMLVVCEYLGQTFLFHGFHGNAVSQA